MRAFTDARWSRDIILKSMRVDPQNATLHIDVDVDRWERARKRHAIRLCKFRSMIVAQRRYQKNHRADQPV